MTDDAAIESGRTAVLVDPDATPCWRDTYALSYAYGLLWLAVALVGLGTQPALSFNAIYDLLLILPPIATGICVLVTDPCGSLRTLPFRALVLVTVAGIVSVISTVLLTPLLVFMFREGVGHDLGLTGLISAITLVIVGSPMVFGLVRALRKGRWAWAVVLLLGVAAAGVVLAMALSPGGALASLLRTDQAEMMMITVSWWLPVYAATAASARTLGMA